MKNHAVLNVLGKLLHVQLPTGNVHSIKMAENILSHVHLTKTVVLTEKAYGA